MSGKTINLNPSFSHFFWWYLTGLLLVPLFGIGFIVLILSYKKQSAISYSISNQSITKTNRYDSETVDLADILEVTVHQSWVDRKLKAGKLTLITDHKRMDMVGIQNPNSLSDLIMQASEVERARIRKQEEISSPPLDEAPVSLDRLDYLTGLWQQGLLSDEDFKKEKTHFES